MKISDYKLAASALKEVCRIRELPFVDLDVSFQEGFGLTPANELRVGDTSSLGQTLQRIVSSYIDNAVHILGKPLFEDSDQKDDFLLHFATMVRNIVIADKVFDEGKEDSPHSIRLYQEPFLWIVMKDLICPVYKIGVKNIMVVCGTSPRTDGAIYYEEGELTNPNAPKEEFVFINYDMQNKQARAAMALLEVIRGHGLDPKTTMQELFESDLYEKLLGAAYLAFEDDEKVEEFVAVIFKILDFNTADYPHIKMATEIAPIRKSAQAYDSAQVPNTMKWWYLGLTEKMLEPVRGYDWDTHCVLEPYIEQFWNRVEEIKSKKKQGEGVPFNQLLRLKSKQTVDDPLPNDVTLQRLLGSERIW